MFGKQSIVVQNVQNNQGCLSGCGTILGIFILLGIAINFVESLGPFFGALLFGLVGLCVGIYGGVKINNYRTGSNLTIEKTLDQINKWDLAKIKRWRPKQKHTFYCVYGTGLVGAFMGLISGASVAG